MIYELRIYHIFPGRMEAIHQRFANATLSLFEKHGLRVYDFWEDLQGDHKLYYILEHEDLETRHRNFDAFRNDPDWIAVKTRSEVEAPIVEKVEEIFMKRVPYSPFRP